MKFNSKLGVQLLGVWLIMTGLLKVVSIQIPTLGTIMAVLAICAGILLLR